VTFSALELSKVIIQRSIHGYSKFGIRDQLRCLCHRSGPFSNIKELCKTLGLEKFQVILGKNSSFFEQRHLGPQFQACPKLFGHASRHDSGASLVVLYPILIITNGRWTMAIMATECNGYLQVFQVFLNMCDFPLPFRKLQFILGTIFAIGSRSQPQRNQLRGSAVVPRVTLWCFKEGKNWAAWLVHSWVPTFPALVKPRNVWGPGCVRWCLNRISGVSDCYTLVRLIYKLNQLTTGRPYLVEWIPLGGLNHLLWGRELHYARGIPICINMSIY